MLPLPEGQLASPMSLVSFVFLVLLASSGARATLFIGLPSQRQSGEGEDGGEGEGEGDGRGPFRLGTRVLCVDFPRAVLDLRFGYKLQEWP